MTPFVHSDLEPLHSLWSDEDVRRFLWDNQVIPIETVQEILEAHYEMASQFRIGFWSIARQNRRPEGPIEGFVGFRPMEGGAELELLYGIRREWWGKGIATTASQAALEYLWQSTNFGRVLASTDPPNVKSREVMKRLGMTLVKETDGLIVYALDRPN